MFAVKKWRNVGATAIKVLKIEKGRSEISDVFSFDTHAIQRSNVKGEIVINELSGRCSQRMILISAGSSSPVCFASTIFLARAMSPFSTGEPGVDADRRGKSRAMCGDHRSN